MIGIYPIVKEIKKEMEHSPCEWQVYDEWSVIINCYAGHTLISQFPLELPEIHFPQWVELNLISKIYLYFAIKKLRKTKENENASKHTGN